MVEQETLEQQEQETLEQQEQGNRRIFRHTKHFLYIKEQHRKEIKE